MSLTVRSKSSQSLVTSEPPILPAPMMPTLTKDLKLVEERPFGEPLALFGRDLDVARGQKEDPVGDALYLAVQSVGQPGAEIHHPAPKLLVGLLEVQDHGLLALEAVGQSLGVVEARRDHDAHPR